MKDKLILKDGTVIELEAAANLTGITTIFIDWTAAAATLPLLTDDNLSSVQVQTGDGLSVGNYSDLVLQPGGWDTKADGVHITISLREKTDIEKRMDSAEDAIDILAEGALSGGETA